MIGPGNIHRCSGDPIEAGSYCLQAEGAKIDKFRANGKAELTAEVGETPEQELIAVDLPVDFSKQDLDKVNNTELQSHKIQKIVYLPDNFVLKLFALSTAKGV